MHETSKHPNGDAAGTAAGKKMPEGRRFSGDYAREMGKRRSQKRLEQAAGPPTRNDHVTLPADQAAVFEAIRDKAKTGNPQAVREYREWLTRLQLVSGNHDQDVLDKRLEDMTPDELAFADAWAERQLNKALRRAKGLGLVHEEKEERAGA
jgi:hypothetical protein